MTQPSDPRPPRRTPLVFDVSDPSLVVETPSAAPAMTPTGNPSDRSTARQDTSPAGTAEDGPPANAPTASAARRFRPGWLSMLVAALTGLVSLAAGLAFASFVSDVLARSDWIGMAGWSLLGLAALAAFVLAMRELVGLMRLGRLAHLRTAAETALRARDTAAERQIVKRMRQIIGARPNLAWAAARFAEHEQDVRDPGDLFALADRELMSPLDAEARRLILTSAKRVSLVTAMSPVAFLAVAFVLLENLRLLRGLATVYGGRPGFVGSLRLARLVFVHILATGGVALTDDLIGQFVGQDLARRLSRRLGEGLFNGALTARIGVAALDICRPLPFVEAKPVRIRDILAELTRRTDRPPAESFRR